MRIDVYNYFILFFFFCYFQKANFLWLNSFFLGYFDLLALIFLGYFFVYKKILAIALIRRCQ
jgi:hypothetical protein